VCFLWKSPWVIHSHSLILPLSPTSLGPSHDWPESSIVVYIPSPYVRGLVDLVYPWIHLEDLGHLCPCNCLVLWLECNSRIFNIKENSEEQVSHWALFYPDLWRKNLVWHWSHVISFVICNCNSPLYFSLLSQLLGEGLYLIHSKLDLFRSRFCSKEKYKEPLVKGMRETIFGLWNLFNFLYELCVCLYFIYMLHWSPLLFNYSEISVVKCINSPKETLLLLVPLICTVRGGHF